MIAAVRGPSAARNASTSTPPSGADGMVTVLKPAIEAVAGFVPCAESGTRTSVRSDVAAAAVVGPDHEDAGQLALGAGRGLERHGLHAADLRQRPLQLPEKLQRALGKLVRARAGGARRSPSSRAAHSSILGLYFIVHEPSG